MPETRNPVTPKGVTSRIPAWLRNSIRVDVLVRFFSAVRTSALLATIIGFLRRTAGWTGRKLRDIYRALAPRVVTTTRSLLGSKPAVKTIEFGDRAVTVVRDRATAVGQSAAARRIAGEGDKALTSVKNSALGRATGRGIAAARRRLPDWAVARVDGDGKSAWRVAIADSGAGLLVRSAVAIGVVGVVALGLMGSPTESTGSAVTTAADIPAERSVDDQAGRSDDRVEPESGATDPAEKPAPADPQPEATEPEPDPEPKPVAGLNQMQMDNAVQIVEVGEEMGISEEGQAIALATAMQESQMLVLANTGLPASLDVENQGTGFDHDSVGLFQQRPSSGWGTIEECMDVEYSSKAFYSALKRINGWTGMDLTVAAQAVQGSAFPDAYAKWEGLAWDIIEAAK